MAINQLFLSSRVEESVMTIKIDGKALADEIIQRVAKDVATFKQEHNITPGLAVC